MRVMVGAMAALAGIAASGGPEIQAAPRIVPKAPKPGLTRAEGLRIGKPPMNGSREMARRVRQMERDAASRAQRAEKLPR